MLIDDHVLTEALGPRCPDVVLSDDVQHPCAHLPREIGEAPIGHGGDRHDDVQAEVPEVLSASEGVRVLVMQAEHREQVEARLAEGQDQHQI